MINDHQLKAGWQIWHSYDAVPKDNLLSLSLFSSHKLIDWASAASKHQQRQV